MSSCTGRRQKELDEAVSTIGTNVSVSSGRRANWLTSIRLTRPSLIVKGRIDILVFANARRWRICSLWGRHQKKHFDKLFNIQCEGNAVHGAKRPYRY